MAVDSHSSPSWRVHANPALRTIWANFKCSSERGGVLGLAGEVAAARLLERDLLEEDGEVGGDWAREISLKIPPKVWARVRT